MYFLFKYDKTNVFRLKMSESKDKTDHLSFILIWHNRLVWVSETVWDISLEQKKESFSSANKHNMLRTMETYVLSWKITTTRKRGQSPDNSILDDVSNSMTVCCIRMRKIGTQSESHYKNFIACLHKQNTFAKKGPFIVVKRDTFAVSKEWGGNFW